MQLSRRRLRVTSKLPIDVPPMFLRGHTEKILQHYAGLLGDAHGENTPERFLFMLDELTECKDCIGACIKWRDFPTESNDMVVVQQIPFSSVCNHHVVPFVGFAHIAYVPEERIAGLSKFARTVHHFARRLQVQEDLTYQIANYIEAKLRPKGIAVVMRAEHLCMTIRGVQAPGTYTTTSRMTGVFGDHSRTAKQEFLQYLNGKH
jgi:GTP cyclohydrolase IA